MVRSCPGRCTCEAEATLSASRLEENALGEEETHYDDPEEVESVLVPEISNIFGLLVESVGERRAEVMNLSAVESEVSP